MKEICFIIYYYYIIIFFIVGKNRSNNKKEKIEIVVGKEGNCKVKNDRRKKRPKRAENGRRNRVLENIINS